MDTRTLALVLLGGDAGLRRGEMIGLRWCDIDMRRHLITVQQAVWKGIVDSPKSGRGRVIPTTDALDQTLARHRHLRGERVFYDDGGHPATEKILRGWLAAAQRRAGLPDPTGALHILRHTFCSHLAMRGAPAKAIQELAGRRISRRRFATCIHRRQHASRPSRSSTGALTATFLETLWRRATEPPQSSAIDGGGAGNRTQVRKRLAHASTYVADSLYRSGARLPAGSLQSYSPV
jgi:hypothetical protein